MMNYLCQVIFTRNSQVYKQYAVKYSGVYQSVNFSAEVEYINNKIVFLTFIDASHYSEASFEITDFIRWIVKMPKGDLIRRIREA
jgi:hypothetical protein